MLFKFSPLLLIYTHTYCRSAVISYQFIKNVSPEIFHSAVDIFFPNGRQNNNITPGRLFSTSVVPLPKPENLSIERGNQLGLIALHALPLHLIRILHSIEISFVRSVADVLRPSRR
jgi:hypothetical protein